MMQTVRPFQKFIRNPTIHKNGFMRLFQTTIVICYTHTLERINALSAQIPTRFTYSKWFWILIWMPTFEKDHWIRSKMGVHLKEKQSYTWAKICKELAIRNQVNDFIQYYHRRSWGGMWWGQYHRCVEYPREFPRQNLRERLLQRFKLCIQRTRPQNHQYFGEQKPVWCCKQKISGSIGIICHCEFDRFLPSDFHHQSRPGICYWMFLYASNEIGHLSDFRQHDQFAADSRDRWNASMPLRSVCWKCTRTPGYYC